MRRTVVVLALLALALAALPAAAAAKTVAFKGTVVKKSAAPAGYVVAQRTGRLRLVRTAAKLRVGRVVSVRGRLLADRSVKATRIRRFGLARRVRVRGVVLGRTRSLVTVGGNGTSVSIHRRSTASLLSHGASAGAASVVEDCTIDHGKLDENASLPAGAAVAVEFSGAVVSADGGKLVLSIDGVLLTIQVPASVDVSGLTLGTIVEVRVAIGTDPQGVATLTLVGFHSEDGEDGHHHGHRHHHRHGHHRGFEVTGTVSLGADGSVTVQNAGGSVTFASKGEADLTGITNGECVEAKGATMKDGSLVLVRIEPSNECTAGGGGMGGQGPVEAHGTLTVNNDGTITVDGTTFTVGSVDISGFSTGDCVDAKGTAQGDGTNALDELKNSTCS
jgi:hypothetical protein